MGIYYHDYPGGRIVNETALTLTQPWATLGAIGAKKIETRGWRHSLSGTLAIHAAKSFPKWAKDTCNEPSLHGN